MDKIKLEARRKAKAERLTQERNNREKSQLPVKAITITIEWKKSRMWSNNPHAEAGVEFHNGTFERRDRFTCSGCGYDKESTVIASIFNAFLLYKLWAMPPKDIKGGHGSGDKGPAPYGITNYQPEWRGYSGGIGTSCYYRISEYIGGKFEHIASGKMFDVYKYTDGRETTVENRT